MKTLGQRLKALAEARKLEEPDVANILGVTTRAYNYYVNDERTPSLESLIKLSDFYGTSLDELIAGRRVSRTETIVVLDAEEYAPIPRIEAEIAAGTGSINSAEVVAETFAFRLDWLRTIGVAPANGCLVKVRGDSMEPLLRDRDVVLIDRARTQVKTGQVYALRDGGEARVKRLDRPDPETLVLRSDNPAHPLEFRRGAELEAVTILGQVVWSGHTW